ncbi:hypothetical protein HPB48_007974 [Haemaphysalis longicornis]|uniref:Reverse transcriptase domain-containing protein n=1 Tax=Haemaphysalis longicornis TaxID=44386 RepID=A0A9J6GKH0_HAELO|nr:hypothetical protein HPB48_007974 [Haemaphysalis longicornis]
MERMVPQHFHDHLEEATVIPYNMLGFRHLSTQDALLALHEEVMAEPSLAKLKTILEVDHKKASDCVDHDAILEELAASNCGPSLYHYDRDFLRGRSLVISIGEHETPPFPHPQRGIPEGAVLSPTLLNHAALEIHRALKQVEDVHHLMYADDISIWIKTGSPGHIETQLQEALNKTQEEAETIGLTCFTEKNGTHGHQQTVEGTPLQITLRCHPYPANYRDSWPPPPEVWEIRVARPFPRAAVMTSLRLSMPSREDPTMAAPQPPTRPAPRPIQE